MSRTHRTASIWMESRFKWGDPNHPQENESHYFNGRYKAKTRNGSQSYHSNKIDPLSYKVASWKEYNSDVKLMAKRSARRAAKILVKKTTLTILLEIQINLEELMIDYEDWYHTDESIGFDFTYSDEAYDYAEQRRQEELEDDYLYYGYEPYMDWEY
jgi:hypothetical protein